MIDKLIAYALQNRFMTLVVFSVLTLVSIFAVFRTPVDAIPDLSENQVIVMTEWSGQSPQNIEDQVTYPVTVGMQGLPHVKAVRSTSMLGVSMVTVIFEDGTDIYFARERVAERLNVIRGQLPPDVMAVLGPDATGVGHIFMYTLESDSHSLTDLRTMQDFIVRYGLQSLPGVAEVASVGGYVKTYQVALDPVKLDQQGLSVMSIMQAIQGGNNNVSGKVLEYGEREIVVQGIGFFQSPEEIRHVVLGRRADGALLTINDVGTVRISSKFRRGMLVDATGEKVGGIVIMRYGENPLAVIDHVKTKIEELEKTLPEGVKIVPFYDRTELIRASINTLRDVLLQVFLITAVVLWIFLLHGKATIITSVSLLFGVLMTFLFMYIFGISSNIMSLGGIAIAIGAMVDSSIVMTENAYQHLLERPVKTFPERFSVILASAKEVGAPTLYAMLVILVSFVPIFALEGMEGKLFRPLAFTNIFGMAGAIIGALFLVPVLCLYFLKGTLKTDDQIPAVNWFQSLYKPLLLWALNARKRVFLILGGLTALSVLLGMQMGSEFMPPLDEGAILYMPMTVPDISERKARELLLETNKIIARFPEVETVVGKAGRAETATDPAPLAMIETFITLKPKSEWRSGMTKEKLVAEMNDAIHFPNFWNGFTQPIIGRINMVSTGIRSQVGIKIFGNDPQVLENLAIETERLMSNVPGATGVVALRNLGLKYLNVDLDEEKLALYGIPKEEALNLIEIGTGGKVVTRTIEGRENYGVEIKFQRPFREGIPDVQALTLGSMDGKRIPLSAVANVRTENGPAMLQSENGKLRGAVQVNVSGRDLMSFVKESREYLEENLKLPTGYSIEFDGQYKNQIRARQTLSWVVPAVIVVIFLILYLTYSDFGLVSIVMLAIPLSVIGGIISLWLARFNFSVAVWVGFIALFGNAVETGVVIVMYLENALQEKIKSSTLVTKQIIHDAILEGATRRLRPVLMTAFASVLGLLPMLISMGVGAEVQKPLAIVVAGGLVTSISATLLMIPIFFDMLRQRSLLTHK